MLSLDKPLSRGDVTHAVQIFVDRRSFDGLDADGDASLQKERAHPGLAWVKAVPLPTA
jgi:hypothetical protein